MNLEVLILHILGPKPSLQWCHMSVMHYSDVTMIAMASQITGFSIVYWTVCSGADQWQHQKFTSLAFVREIHRWPLNSQNKGTVTRKMFPFDDVVMGISVHWPLNYLFNSLLTSDKEISKLCINGLCVGKPPVADGFPTQRATGRFPTQRASNMFHDIIMCHHCTYLLISMPLTVLTISCYMADNKLTWGFRRILIIVIILLLLKKPSSVAILSTNNIPSRIQQHNNWYMHVFVCK